MFISILLASPAIALAWAIAIFLSLTVHEFSHGLAAKLRGDLTAEREGRLTLNPVAHIDPMGLIFLFLLGFGWAKPVPYNPYNLRNPKWDSVFVGLAGPGSNLILAIICGIALRFMMMSPAFTFGNLLVVFLFLMILLNLFLLFFNLIPVHPLDGSKLFFALFDKPQHARLRHLVATQGPNILLILVLISIFTPFDVFFFVTAPSFAVCDALVGGSCSGVFAQIFALI